MQIRGSHGRNSIRARIATKVTSVRAWPAHRNCNQLKGRGAERSKTAPKNSVVLCRAPPRPSPEGWAVPHDEPHGHGYDWDRNALADTAGAMNDLGEGGARRPTTARLSGPGAGGPNSADTVESRDGRAFWKTVSCNAGAAAANRLALEGWNISGGASNDPDGPRRATPPCDGEGACL